MMRNPTKRNLARRATVAITMKLRGNLHLIGTGILVDIDDHSFVITAAHVIQGSQKYQAELGLIDVKGKFVGLDNDWKCLILRNYGAPYDPIDVAIHEIDSYQRNQLNHAEFLTLQNMDLISGTSRETYFLYGFPFSLVKRDEISGPKLFPRPLTVSIFRYRGSTHLIANYEEQFHLLLDARHLDDRNIFGDISLHRSIEGISGSGVWIEDDNKAEKIVGLQTGVYQRHHLIKATRWSMVMKLLYNALPEFGSKPQ